MCNKKEVRYIFRNNDAVYADACTLMNVDRLEMFLERYGGIMRKTGTKIIVPASVRKELFRLAGLEDPQKKKKANSFIGVLPKYSELIRLEGGDLSGEAVDRVHADPEVIAMLTLRRRTDRQLLITNDGGLASDVYGLNSLRSCHGKPITVCYIDRDGYLKLSDCMTAAKENAVPNDLIENEKTESFTEQPITHDEPIGLITEEAVQPKDTIANAPLESKLVEGDKAEGNDSDGSINPLMLVIGMVAAGIAGSELHRHHREIRILARQVA